MAIGVECLIAVGKIIAMPKDVLMLKSVDAVWSDKICRGLF